MYNDAVLIIGGSAGGLDVLMAILPFIRPDINIPVIIVLHRKNSENSRLTDLLASRTTLRVKEIEEKEPVQANIIYLAPPDYHVLIEQDHTFSLDYSEKVNFSRPSIDVVFQSAAEVYKNNLVCLLLSGSSADGVAGLQAVKRNGGKAAAQEPGSAGFAYMPEQATLNVDLDEILEIGDMHTFINGL